MAEKQVTDALIVPSSFRMLLEYAQAHGRGEQLRSLRHIYLGAEAVTADLLEKYVELTGHGMERLNNLYGPTEGTVCVTSMQFEEGDLLAVPIGKPLWNTQIYMMNGNEACGVGVPGEICIAGAGVARGYLNRPDLTAEKFVENPVRPGERMYRTGDLGRWMGDGRVEYLGRIGEQVKIRGYRIELGEIEARLREIRGVQDAVVIVRTDQGDPVLCGYVVSAEKVDLDQVKEKLGANLPSYMIPSHLMQLEQLPQTRSGKLDKKALPKPEMDKSRPYTAPRDEIEECIAEVFQEILGTERISIDDSFYELGGDSIKAIRIVSKLRERNYDLTVRTIMQERSIRAIRAEIRKTEDIPSEQGEVKGEVTLTPIQRNFFSFELAKPHHFNQSFMLESTEKIEEESLRSALQAVTIHHDMLRASFNEGIQTIRPVSDGQLYELRIWDCTDIQLKNTLYREIEVRANELQTSMDLLRGPLLKAGLFRGHDQDYILLVIHHLVVDGISWRIIIEDLYRSYVAAQTGKNILLPSKTISFQSWSEALIRYRDSYDLKREIPYWQEIEQKVKACQSVLTGKESGEGLAHIDLSLTPEETSDMLYKAGKAYHTEMNDLLLTALYRAVHQLSGQHTVAVCLEGHGRESIGENLAIDRTVGWFTSVYPVAVSEIGKSIRDDIRNTKESLRRVPNRGMGYGVLNTTTNQNLEGVMPEITFNYLGEFGQENSTDAWKLSEAPRGNDLPPENNFGTAMSFNGAITGQTFQFTLSYDQKRCKPKQMEELAGQFKQQLIEIIAHCIHKKETERTASDFGELLWDDADFIQVEQRLNEEGFAIERIYPLTPLQEGMLYHKLADEKSSSYVVQTVYHTKSLLKQEVLRESLDLLAEKHEILRSSIIHTGVKEPRQALLRGRALEFDYSDLTSEKSPTLNFEMVRNNDVNRGFNLEKDSLIRVSLIKLQEDEYRMIMTFHHIIMDGWCMSILMNDLLHFYYALEGGSRPEAITQSSRYEQYVRLIEQQDKESGLQYWGELLEGYGEQTGVRAEGRPEGSQEEVGRVETFLTPEQSQRLEEISIQFGVTVNTMIEAAWGILLQRYNRTSDAVFGKVVSGRSVELEGIEEMLGLFINTVPVRVKCNDRTSLKELLNELQNQALQSTQYEYCSLSDIQNQNELGSELIQTMLAFENYYEQKNEEQTKIHLSLEQAREQTNYPLTLVAYKSDMLALGLMYDTRTYGETEVQRILNRLTTILLHMIKYPEGEIGDIEVVGQAEMELILDHFNDTSAPYSKEKTVIELFEEQVLKIPNHLAVVSNGQQLTYAELNSKANQLAGRLRDLGTLPNQFVGIMAERRVETIIGLLAVLKAGGAYLPLDPKYPVNRIQYILKDSGTKILLVGTEAASDIPANIETICIANEEVFVGPISNIEQINKPDDLAYLMYTSGTTGEPKGVMIEHRSINRLIINTNYADLSEVRILQTGSLAFDASTFEIWGALLNGGRLILVEEEVLTNSTLLKKAISDYQINTLWLTVSLFNHMIALDKQVFNEVQQLLIGGEQLSVQHVKWMKANNKNTRLINGYGPTESTTFAVTYEIKDMVQNSIPIGQPIRNTQVYLMNGEHFCGIGMPGELLVGGPGVARGYLNQPELTSAKFIPSPYRPGEMLYRTGDMACWTSDGNIEYLGRIDQQVKVRGYRIELGEISEKIRGMEDVQEATVVVKEMNGDKHLCAYFAAARLIEVSFMRSALAESLPPYMIPTHFMQIDRLPTTRNGKLDISALPLPIAEVSGNYTAPRDEIEQKIAEAFQEVLGVECVGIKDNFFELGGHSLRATRLVNIMEQKLGVRIPLRDVISEQTVENLALKVKESAQVEQYAPIPEQPKQFSYDMSSAQKRLYVIDQIQGDNITYNMPEMIRIYGKLDLKRFQYVMDQLIHRHEALRTSFTMEKGEPVQKIADQVKADLEYSEGNSEEIDKLFQDFVRPFNLSQAPLMRMKVVRINEDEYVLMSDFHHIIFDGRSSGIWMDELSSLYNGQDLPERRIHYKDYSAWQNSKNLQEQEEYWVHEFSGELPVLDLQTDYPRPQQQSYRGCSITASLDRETKLGVKRLSKKTGATEYMILLSTFMLLLSRYSRQEEIVVGSPISGRVHPDTENMLGMFVNTLAIKGNLSSTQTFDDLVRQLKERCLNAYENQEYPFEQLVDRVAGERDLSRNPLFDVMFALQNNETTELRMEGIRLEHVPFENDIAKFDLTVSMTEFEDGYLLNWEYCTDLFKLETIERMCEHFKNLLQNAISVPEQLLSNVEMVSLPEREQLLYTFNSTDTDYPYQYSVVELFEDQVERTPMHVAVSLGKEHITYADLNAKSNQLARQLRAAGVCRNQFVGIMAERKIETIIGLLAILKAGGAYLPIDPKYPYNRIKFLLSDSQSQVILTRENSVPTDFAGQSSIKHINILDEEHYSGQDSNLQRVNIPDDLAYIIYTSGTTGQPKGVMIEHRSINRLVRNTNYADFTRARILQTGSLAFDASTFEIWGALLNGGSFCFVEEEVLSDAKLLEHSIADNQVNMMFITTALYNQMIRLNPHVFDSLQQLLFGGEATSEEHVDILTSRNPGIRFSNVYGPTESTTFATYYQINGNAVRTKTPIGKPISNTQAYVITEGKLCGIGVPGELYIGGAGVARGYLNRPKLTQEKFIDNPYRPGERMYRTGDLVRWLEDGNIEYLGRMDDQVKLRGFRIELGEIESKLRDMHEIEDAAVIVREDQDRYLCGYVVGEKQLDMAVIRERLSTNLPNYMIPAHFVQMECIPLTRNGKLDKRSLPKPEITASHLYAQPRDAVETSIVEVFQEILGAEKVGIDDSFYELGGDSIKAIRMVSKLRERGYDLNVRTIMQGRTVRNIRIDIQSGVQSTNEQGEVNGLVNLTPIQKEFFAFELTNPHHFNQSFMLESVERLDEKSLRLALQALVHHHDMLRVIYKNGIQTIRPIGDEEHYDLQIWDYQGIQNMDKLYQVMEIKANDLQSSMELTSGPLLKAGVFRSVERDYLMLSIHHLVVDGISWRIIIEDLYRSYCLAQAEKEIILPPKTLSFQSWSESLLRYRESEALASELIYWTEVEQKVKACGFLFTGNGNGSDTRHIEISLTPQQTSDLLYRASQAYNTEINDLLLTSLFRAIQKVSGENTLAVNMEGHGRESIGEALAIDRTVGWFTSVYPATVEGIGTSLYKDICSTKDSLRQIPNHGIGYGVLKMLGSEVLEGITPEITFNYLGEFGQEEGTEHWRLSEAPRGADVPEENQFGTAISFNGAIQGQVFQMMLSYDRSRCSDVQMEELAGQFKNQLVEVIIHCLDQNSAGRNVEVDQYSHVEKDKDLIEWIWNLVQEKSMLRSVQVEEKAYSVLFVENLSAEQKIRIGKLLKQGVSKELHPHFILPMNRYMKTQAKMDEELFMNMCQDPEFVPLNLIDVNQFTRNISTRIQNKYVPSTLQRSFIETTGTIVHEILRVEGNYEKDEVVDAVRKIVDRQAVLRSSHQKDGGSSIICEHEFCADYYVPYVDMRYAGAEFRRMTNNQLSAIKLEGEDPETINNLIRVVIMRITEQQHEIHIIAHHCVWDKTSTQLFKEQIELILHTPERLLPFKEKESTYMQYINEITRSDKDKLDGNINDSVDLQGYLSGVKEFLNYNSHNRLLKSTVSLVKMGPNVNRLYKERPWNVLMHILRVIARENGLVSANVTSIPMFILQADRNYMEADYMDVLGEFLDMMPVLVDTKQSIGFDAQEHVEAIQLQKRKSHLNYVELLNRLHGELTTVIPEILSINYQGAFDISYEDVQKIVSSDEFRDTPEIFVNSYTDYLVIYYPTYERLQANLEKVLKQEFQILETELQQAPISVGML
ncbi:non-ribosomal peptide synthetase [Paenibacillus sp. Marseille-Q4541]|uniref:non-ribosomal peptide synthetase n=1 Tax=Paenibacillus sp. Marseille-Q4541 TaxID=2831522 RepID=UPI001BA646A3|nr:non-ribosomal peptide synthetase [Paenibacillus sp. Marseille-Q4541]